MAYGASDTNELVDVMSDLYRGAKLLVAVDGGITAEERVLADRLLRAVELSIRANNATLDVEAFARGRGRTNWVERRYRDMERDIARLKADHERWIASLDTGSRLYIPFGQQPPQRMNAREYQSQAS